MPKKIYWCEENGAVYWLEGEEIAYAPMNRENTADLDGYGTVDVWDEAPVKEAEVRAKLA